MSRTGIDIEATRQAASSLREGARAFSGMRGQVATAEGTHVLAGSASASALVAFQVSGRLRLSDVEREFDTLAEGLDELADHVEQATGGAG